MRFKKQAPERRRSVEKAPTSSTYSYYKTQRTSTNEKPIEIKDTDSKLKSTPMIIAIVVIVLSVLYSLTLSADIRVTYANDAQPIYRNSSEYEDYASEIMSGSFKNRTKLTIQTTDVEQGMLEKYPELSAVSFRLPVLGRKSTLVLGLRQPAILLSSSNNKFVLDKNGKVIALAKDVQAGSLEGLLTITDNSGIGIDIGNQAVTTDTVSFISEVNNQLTDKKLKISKLTLPQAANELDVYIEGVSYFIKMDISGDARLQSGSYLAVAGELARQGITPSEYIDVRVEEKVFYK